MLLFGLIAYYIVLSHPDPWQEAALAKKQQTAQEACAAFLAAIPAPLALRRLTQKEQEQLLFQYMSLTFHRATNGFARAIVSFLISLP